MRRRILFVLAWVAFSGITMAGETAATDYVGGAVCAECHPREAAQWEGSHHDLAMQIAGDGTVLGDFENARLGHNGGASTFYTKDGEFMVRTDGPDGELRDYAIKYTFGVDPLQQYLIEFPGGRLQALGLAWDARPEAQGGQRWFHLYPDERITADDELHWTRPGQNWNSMCAECHSTHLQKNYDPATRAFATTWSEIDVACEACHGPGADHVAWAGKGADARAAGDKGLVMELDERRGVTWQIDPETGNAVRSQPRTGNREIEMCARCHSRRSPISAEYVHGESLLDHYLPRLLDEGMYHADGQIDAEVYVYGSFLQSRMYHAGVTCSDCHEPHGLELRAPGNGVCLQCHAAAKYAQTGHHFHKPGSEGDSCIECHMPPKTYMVVDPRHDHSMRIPRPDLSVELGTPNACTNCHADRSAEWAANQVRKWYGSESVGYQRYAETFAAVRRGEPGVGEELAGLVRDTGTPIIARATSLAALGPYIAPATIDAIAQGLSDDDPVIRVAAVQALEFAPADIRTQLAVVVLDDPVRAVRIEAARILASARPDEVSADRQALLDRGLQEYIEAQQVMAERPEAQTSLGNLHAARGETGAAIAAYGTAMELDPAYIPAYVNLADLYRSRGDEAAAEATLRQAAAIDPDNGDVQHALGLSLARQKRTGEAIEKLEQAAILSPENARYVYVYAVALNSADRTEQALMVLQGAQNRFPNNTDILAALVAFHRDMGNPAAAYTYAEKLRAIAP